MCPNYKLLTTFKFISSQINENEVIDDHTILFYRGMSIILPTSYTFPYRSTLAGARDKMPH